MRSGAAAVRLVVVGMAEDYRTHPAFIVNFEADPAARPGQVCLNITRAVDYGVGDHLAERQLGVRSAQPPGRYHPAGPVSGHRHGRHRGGNTRERRALSLTTPLPYPSACFLPVGSGWYDSLQQQPGRRSAVVPSAGPG